MSEWRVYTPTPISAWRHLNPAHVLQALWQHRPLLWHFALREAFGRYKGSYLGILWSLFHPLLLLAVYTFVFGIVLRMRWGGNPAEGRVEFALTLFCGLLLFNIFGECATRGPQLVSGNPNLVKKVVFPLEILPAAVLGAALFHALVSFAILMAGSLVALPNLSWNVLWLPLILLPAAFLSLAAGWFLATVGAFLRDIVHAMPVIIQVIFFATPIVYPASIVPESYRGTMALNPLATIVENGRRVLLWGQAPEWTSLLTITCGSLLLMQIAFAMFMANKRDFADAV